MRKAKRANDRMRWARSLLVAGVVLPPTIITGCATSKATRDASSFLPPGVEVALETKTDRETPKSVPVPSKPRAGLARDTKATSRREDSALSPASADAPKAPSEVSGIAIDYREPSVPPADREFPIDLTAALRLAEVENPLIARARQMIGEALALQQSARVIMLPSLNYGVSYHAHTGNLERSSGVILNLNQQSLYVGGGAMPVTAGPVSIPAVSIFSPITDAVFEPLAAHQRVIVREFDASAMNNNVLREVAVFHFELLAAEAELKARRETAEQAVEVARLTRAYADAQQGREADAERAATELSLIEIEVRQAEEEVAVSAARLARRLHLDQSVRLKPIAPAVEEATIIDPSTPLPELIEVAVRRRPEAGSRSAAISEAEYRHKQEIYRPLLPTVGLGFSGGAFGGGSNLVGPSMAHFGGRTDFDVMAFWTLRNFGFGNLALQRQRRAEVGQAVGAQSQTISEIRKEVSAAYADGNAAKNRIGVATRQLASAELGFREDLDRIRNTVGRPIEAVNSLKLLNEARVDRIRAVLDYNKAQIQLFVSLGSPPPQDDDGGSSLGNAPVAEPPLPPLDGLMSGQRGHVAQRPPVVPASMKP